MAMDFRSARFWAREMVEQAVAEGARAIDATMGNGHDTQWLCELVGDSGHVYAFDIQPEAVQRTRERLAAGGLLGRSSLFCVGHQEMDAYVDERVDAIVFNLGWLPKAEHGKTTKTETTLQAVEIALRLLKEEGLLTVCIYPGHEEGKKERSALLDWAAHLDEQRYDALLKTYLNQTNDPPQLLAIRKKKQK